MRPVVQSILEFVVIAVVGSAIGLALNGLSVRGVILTYDYYPRLHVPSNHTPVETKPAAISQTPTATQPNRELEAAAEALRREGLLPICHEDVVALFNDPLYNENTYVFVDARDDQNYTHGHIPGALQLDRLHIERYIDQVWPFCQQALKVVAYCNGGDCEDSKYAAIELLNRGLPPDRVFVYPGGMTEWKEADLPVERGTLGSGDIVPGSQLGDNP